MEEIKRLFKEENFKKKRNEIFNEFYTKVQSIEGENQTLLNKYKKFIEKNKNQIISIHGFKFVYTQDYIFLEHEKGNKPLLSFNKIKPVEIYNIINNLSPINEYICGENYLNYILAYIYKMKNPKYCNDINDIKSEENSSISLKRGTMSNFMDSTYNIIYNSEKPTINYEGIKLFKNISFLERNKTKTDEYFLKSTGLDKFQDPENIFFETPLKRAVIDELIDDINNIVTERVIFHNDNDYLSLETILKFDFYYVNEIYYYLYINFEIIKNLKRNKRLEYFAYCLLSLFPENYESFNNFFEEKIKNELTNNFTCLPKIIKIIINYIEENILNEKRPFIECFDSLHPNSEKRKEIGKPKVNFLSKKNDEESTEDIITEIKQDDKNKNNDDDYDSLISKEKFVFIFDNVNNSDYFELLDNFIYYLPYSSYFKFLIIVPLNNDYSYNLFTKFITYGKNMYFANFNNIDEKDELYNQKVEEDLDIFSNDTFEETFYNLLRIFNFQDMYNIEDDKNKFPIASFKKFIRYFNFEFDNKRQKISKLVFKNKNVEEKFTQKYSDILNFIKIKENYKFPNISKQIDYLELEKLIIFIIMAKKQKDDDLMVELFVHSIFGFKKVEINKDIDYNSLNIMIKQRSKGGEVFDFAIKIKFRNKTYLKFYQITGFKSKEDLEKLIQEKISIYTSYIVKEFEKNNLGKIDGVSFGIITFTEIYNQDVYRTMKKHCKVNGFEYILFDINEMSFKIRQNGKYKDYNNEMYEFDDKYNLNINKFDNIIKVNNNIQLEMISPRKIKELYLEYREDLEAEKIFKKISKQNNQIKRVAKFKFKGSFNDIKRLDKKYFIYYYDNKGNKAYLFDDKITNNEQNNDSNKRIRVILYAIMPIKDEYNDSSIDMEKDNTKNKTRVRKRIKSTNNKKKKNYNKSSLNNILDYEESDESYSEINSKNREITTKNRYYLRERKNSTKSLPKENLKYEHLNKKRKNNSDLPSKRKK